MHSMKKRFIFGMMCITIICTLSLPVMAQEWQSVSTMPGSGSAYVSQVTPVGAMETNQQATTTYDANSPKRIGFVRKSDFGGGQDGGYKDPNSPIGEAWCLLAFAALFTLRIAHKNLFNKKAKQ